MRDAIFLAVAGHAEIQIRIGQFRRAADRALVERLILAARLRFKTLSALRYFAALPRFAHDLGSEKDQVIAQGSHQRHAIRRGSDDKSKKQKCCEDPRDPFNFRRQDEQNINDLIRVKPGEGEEQRRGEHAVGEPGIEEKCGRGGADHPDEKIKREPESSPRALQAFPDEPEKPKNKDDPPAECLREKNVSDQSPDFALANSFGVEFEEKPKIGIQKYEQPDERSEPDDDANQTGDSEKTQTAFELVEPGHSVASIAHSDGEV